jgi:tetratricopeptide (TPR) repeat protein
MQEEVKKLYKELETCTNNDERLRIMFDIATNLLNFDQKRALQVADEIKAFADEIDHNVGRVYYHSTQGRVFFKKSMYQDCEREFKEALRLSLLTTSLLEQAMCHDSLGVLCTYLNRHDDALTACQEALVIYKQINTRPAFRYQVVCYNNVGVTYRKMYKLDKAEEAFHNGLRLVDEFEVGTMRFTLLNNLAKVKLVNGLHSEGFALANEAMKGFKLANHKNGMANASVTIANYYLSTGKYALALTHFLNVFKLLKAIDNKVAEIAAYRGLGNVYVKMEAFAEADKYLEKAKGLAIATGDDQELCKVFMAQAKAYIAEQRNDMAAEKYKLGLELTKMRKLPYLQAVFEDLYRNLDI